jgi:hypothetical protein
MNQRKRKLAELEDQLKAAEEKKTSLQGSVAAASKGREDSVWLL